MTYREKLQKEHPECVGREFKGGCKMCPANYGYEADKSQCPCKEPGYDPFSNPGNGCTRCWDRVIPGTEDVKEQYAGAIALIRDLENEIEILKEKNDDKDKEIEILKEQIKKLEQKNEAYSKVCAIYKSKDAIIEKQEKEIKVLKADNVAADIMIEERDQKIQKLEGACSAKNAEIVRLDRELRDTKQLVLWYRLNSNTVYGSLSPCHCSGCDERDMEIKRLKHSLGIEISHKNYWYNGYHNLWDNVCELENSNRKLKDALAEEKKEHAKHHSLFGKYFAD